MLERRSRLGDLCDRRAELCFAPEKLLRRGGRFGGSGLTDFFERRGGHAQLLGKAVARPDDVSEASRELGPPPSEGVSGGCRFRLAPLVGLLERGPSF